MDKSGNEKSGKNKSKDGDTGSKKSKDKPTSAIKSVKPASANKSTKPTSAIKPKSQKVNSTKVKSVNTKTNKDKLKSVKSTKKGGDNSGSGGSKKNKQPKSADKTKPKSADSQKIKSAPVSTKSKKSNGGEHNEKVVGTSKKEVKSKSQKKPQSTKKDKPKSKKEKSLPKSKKTAKKKETKGKVASQANKAKSSDDELETSNKESSEPISDLYEPYDEDKQDEQGPTDDEGDDDQEKMSEEEEQLPAKEAEQAKTKAKTLEFTKPTINQMVKEKKEVPMGYDEHISRVEFEALYDEVNDLNAGVFTLRSSYGSIIKSLVNMHSRRQKKKQQQQSKPANEINFLTTLSEISKKQAKELESCLDNADKYDIERFMNPVTREDTFNALFEECAQLSAKTEKIRTVFFDAKGNFMREEYDRATEHKVDRKRFNHYRQWGKKLSAVIDEICRNYNDDLLNMFRLDS